MGLVQSFYALYALVAAPLAGASAESATGSQPISEGAKKEISAPRRFQRGVMGESLSEGWWASVYGGGSRHQ
jgi:hypothetical protein